MLLRCVSYTPMQGQTLKGFAALKFLETGLELRDIGLHEGEDGQQWITLPRKAFNKNGQRTFFHYVAFPDIRDRKTFERLALEAIRDFMGQRVGCEHFVNASAVHG